MNDLGQPIGWAVPNWIPACVPPREPVVGRTVRLEPFDASKHGDDLWTAVAADTHGSMWTYLPAGPFTDRSSFDDMIGRFKQSPDPMFYAVIDTQKMKALGWCTYLRINPDAGSIEIGWIAFAPALQRTVCSTEAMYLMMARAFDDLGYRRYEWKCDALNQKSYSCAERLGFTFEGVFRQCTMYKGRNRDTAWFSVLDSEWPCVKKAFQNWLDPSNFDVDGNQHQPLKARASCRH